MALDLSVVDKPLEPQIFSYSWKDTVLYALGVGAKKDELDWLYEGRGPKVLPSFAVVPMFKPMLDCVVRTGGDLSMVVHGKQSVRLHADLPPEATVSTVARVRGLYDMRKFAIVVIDCEIKDAAAKLLAETSSQIIIRGAGNFGGEAPPKEEKVAEAPKGQEPDFRFEEKTAPEQALLYRLSGDWNPLHADPEFAARVGFEQGPILHGLCTFGHMVRHVGKVACGGDSSRLVAFETKFSKPVWPGDTLVTEGWNVAPGKIALQVKAKERDEAVCTASWALTRA
ncbi:MAG: MaoC family dehydratase N-terminal domain-containing protein [Labilithrix sp.]|nr:MaoC family dehydratase N-terminal domain-containing protein [Labilithrix sp.]